MDGKQFEFDERACRFDESLRITQFAWDCTI